MARKRLTTHQQAVATQVASLLSNARSSAGCTGNAPIDNAVSDLTKLETRTGAQYDQAIGLIDSFIAGNNAYDKAVKAEVDQYRNDNDLDPDERPEVGQARNFSGSAFNQSAIGARAALLCAKTIELGTINPPAGEGT